MFQKFRGIKSKIREKINERKERKAEIKKNIITQNKINEIDKDEIENSDILKSQNIGFSHMTLFFFLLFVVIFIGSFVSFIESIGDIMEFNFYLGYLYVFGILTLIIYILFFVIREFFQFLFLKKVEKFQEKADKIDESSSKEEIEEFANEILDFYKKSQIKEIRERAKKLKISIKEVEKEEIISLISSEILAPLDKVAESIVYKYARETAIGTAISPVAIVDIAIVIWRNLRMVKEISIIYGYRPQFVSILILLRKISELVVFAGATELLKEYVPEIAGQTLASKLSYNVSQGFANGVMTIRVGMNTISVCRPVKPKKVGKTTIEFIKSLFNYILKKS